jgi:hypothetical protein
MIRVPAAFLAADVHIGRRSGFLSLGNFCFSASWTLFSAGASEQEKATGQHELTLFVCIWSENDFCKGISQPRNYLFISQFMSGKLS